MTNTEVYPSADELLPLAIKRRLPQEMVMSIRERYETFGKNYVSEFVHEDGRRVNQLMQRNNATEANEEIVDAMFCVCAMFFKGALEGAELNYMISHLVGVYSMVRKIEARMKSDG